MDTPREGWVRRVEGYWVYYVGDVIATSIMRPSYRSTWEIAPSDPPLYEADFETAKALAVALYRLEG